jgi:hypothetical protein
MYSTEVLDVHANDCAAIIHILGAPRAYYSVAATASGVMTYVRVQQALCSRGL